MWFFKKRRAKKKAEELERIEAEKQRKEASAKEEKAVTTPKQTTPKNTEPKKDLVKEGVEEKKETKETNAKYHVSQNNDEKSEFYKQWRVRKGGSKKTIKFFNTQAEAIDYAEHLAEQAGSSIVIHKMDGKIRKQDYSKK